MSILAPSPAKPQRRMTPPRPIPPSDDSPARGRVLLGGFLMGLANLVPGVSGGTMILAIGLYDRFIGAVAELTSLRWSRGLFAFLAVLGIGLVVALVGFSGPAVYLVGEYRWAMYSLFIGMTLGGVPQLTGQCRPVGAGVLLAALGGFLFMALLTFGLRADSIPHTWPVLALVGAFAASSMILPGVSGSLILLIFGMYEVVIGSLSGAELRANPVACLKVLAPVVVGAGLGIGLLSNALKALLARFPRPSHGALLGLLCGAVLGLWPFQDSVHPELAHKPTRKAVEMLVTGSSLEEAREATGAALDEAEAERLTEMWAGKSPGDLRKLGRTLESFRPGAVQVGGAILLLLLGFSLTSVLGRRGKGEG